MRTIKTKFLVILAIGCFAIFHVNAWGVSSCIIQEFQNSWDKNYIPKKCQNNVSCLIDRMDENVDDFDIKKAKVWVLLPTKTRVLYGAHFRRNPAELLLYQAQKMPLMPLRNWGYHVVMEYEGFIFDLDINPKSYRPLNVKEYFELMFPGHIPANGIQIRSMDATEYQRRYQVMQDSSNPTAAQKMKQETGELFLKENSPLPAINLIEVLKYW